MRAGALIAVGALGVHDLRYLLAYHGGWLAIPLALLIGLVIALALRGAAAAIAVAAAHGRARLARPAASKLLPRVGRSVWSAPSPAPLARRLAPRAPPASS